MKIVTILGSPRRSGNTAAVLQRFEQRVGEEHEVDRINVGEHVVHGCRACDACQRTLDEPGCIQKDDAPALLQRILDADLVVYATPVYMWSYSAQIKALLDRHYCLGKWKNADPMISLLQGKRSALLVTCGGSAEGNADLAQEAFRRAMDYFDGQIIGQYVVDNCGEPSELGERADQVAEQMAQDVQGIAEGR